jgi:hypothetical protein
VPKYKDAVQLRSTRYPGRDSSGVATVRAKDQRLQQAVEGQREAFQSAINAIAGVSTQLLCSLETNAPAKNREEEAARLKARSAKRFQTT